MPTTQDQDALQILNSNIAIPPNTYYIFVLVVFGRRPKTVTENFSSTLRAQWAGNSISIECRVRVRDRDRATDAAAAGARPPHSYPHGSW